MGALGTARLGPNTISFAQTSLHMASSAKCPSQKKKESLKLGEWASAQLAQLQSPADGSKAFSSQMLEGLMGNLQIGSDSKV